MASISSTSSTSSSGLGNTSLRGFGGLSSGLDRDELIEQMTKSTQTKITSAEAKSTKLEWKQEAFRSITDKVLDIHDNYLSYSSSKSIKDASLYAQNVLTAKGSEEATRYITASGVSDMTKYLQVKGVVQLASSASVVSGVKSNGEEYKIQGTQSLINTGSISDVFDKQATISNIKGKTIEFGTWKEASSDGKTQEHFETQYSVTLPASYTDDDGVSHDINYNASAKEVTEQLNKANLKVGDDFLRFNINDETGDFSISLVTKVGETETPSENAGNLQIKADAKVMEAFGIDYKKYENGDAVQAKDGDGNLKYEEDGTTPIYEMKTHISINEFKAGKAEFETASRSEKNMLDYLADASNKVTMSFNGTSKTFNLLTDEDVEELGKLQARLEGEVNSTAKTNDQAIAEARDALAARIKANISKRENLGSGKVNVEIDAEGKMSITAAKGYENASITITSNDSVLRNNLGITKNESNKLSLNATLWDSKEKLGFASDLTETEFNTMLKNMTINGATVSKKVNGEDQFLNSSSTVNDFLNYINSSDAGVKASYMSNSNKLTLISTTTGKGQQIEFGVKDSSLLPDRESAAKTIFGGEGYQNNDGEDAILLYDYGNGVTEELSSSSNTFYLDGLTINATGTFGVKLDENGEPIKNEATGQYSFDTAQTVRFTASANVDKAVERVKSFIEDFNALVKEVTTQRTTKPSDGYDPLTDAQKDEMSEKSIENWENKAKEGILYNDSTIRSFSESLGGVMTKLLTNLNSLGVNYNELTEIGISTSDDIYDGGILKFDEDKFKSAMETNPEKVSKVMVGANGTSGLAQIVENTLTPYATRYATRNGNSYGLLVEQAGSEKLSLSKEKNAIYTALEANKKEIENLKAMLKSEQERYIKQFTTMESLISDLNNQSSYLSSMLS